MIGRTPLIYCHVNDHSEAVYDDPPLLLSDRQREVLSLAAQGLSSPKIGAALGISRKTVEYHLQLARESLKAKNTTEAAVIAAKQNII